MATLWNKLSEYCAGDAYPLHMPGHKRKWGAAFTDMEAFMACDITEIHGFDNLAAPEGILKEAQERAAEVFGAKETFFLVNGSTSGILTAVSAAFAPGDTVLFAPNCHLSVFRAMELRGLKQVMVQTRGSLPTPEEVEQAFREVSEIKDCLSTPDRTEQGFPEAGETTGHLSVPPKTAKGLILTSPSYEGGCADVQAIAEVVHANGGVLIVDEAHGAHFGFHPGFPESAIRLGADLVVQSLHKTLPALTQTALLHRASDRVSSGQLKRYKNTFQTSSPSYLLMASIDACVEYLRQQEETPFQKMLENRARFDEIIKGLKHVWTAGLPEFPGAVALDPGKLVIFAGNKGGERLSGAGIAEYLRREQHIEPEMAAGDYCLGIMTIADRRSGWERLAGALEAMDREVRQQGLEEFPESDPAKGTVGPKGKENGAGGFPKVVKTDTVKLPEEGTVAEDFAAVYPPGIPVIRPGERWSREQLDTLRAALEEGLEVVGLNPE